MNSDENGPFFLHVAFFHPPPFLFIFLSFSQLHPLTFIEFKFVFVNCFSLFFMKLLQSQINFPIFDMCSIL
jgi:hypothetical protein